MAVLLTARTLIIYSVRGCMCVGLRDFQWNKITCMFYFIPVSEWCSAAIASMPKGYRFDLMNDAQFAD